MKIDKEVLQMIQELADAPALPVLKMRSSRSPESMPAIWAK